MDQRILVGKWALNPVWLLIIAWVILTAPWLTGLKVIPYDSAHYYYPAVAFTVEQLRAFEGPWWNPYVFAGFPQFADPQAMTFQPTMILPMLLSPDISLWWFDVVVLLHLLLAGVGCMRLGKSYGLGAEAQLFFALTFMFGAVASSRLQHTPMIVSYALLPWGWLWLRRVLERPTLRASTACGIVLGLCALQLTQVTYLLGLATCTYVVVGWVIRRDEDKWRRAMALLFAAIVCLVVCAPQLVSTLSVLADTNRTAVTLGASEGNSLRFLDFSTLLAANSLGHIRGSYWGDGEITQTYVYAGAIPLLLCLGWGGLRGRWSTQVRYAWGVVVVGVVFALGTRTPVYPFLHEYLPGLGMFRRPSDALFLVNSAIAFLASIALQRRLEGVGMRPSPALGIALLALLVALVSTAVQASHMVDAFFALLITTILWAGAAWLLRGTARPAQAALALLLVCAVLDLALNQTANRMNSIDGGIYISGIESADGNSPAGYFADALHERIDTTGIPERVEILGVWPISNGGVLRRLPMSTGYNPMIYRRYSKMFGIGPDPLASAEQRRFTDWAVDYSAPAFDLLGVRLVAWGPVMPTDVASFQYVERKTVLPRVLRPRRILRHLGDYPPAGEFGLTDFRSVAWVPTATHSECADAGKGADDAQVSSFSAQSITINYKAREPSWIVLGEMYGEGWQADVDGRPLPVVRANGMFRAVCVPMGEKRLKLSYSPWAMVLAAWD